MMQETDALIENALNSLTFDAVDYDGLIRGKARQILCDLISAIRQQDARAVCVRCKRRERLDHSYGPHWRHGPVVCKASAIHELAQSDAPAAGGRS